MTTTTVNWDEVEEASGTGSYLLPNGGYVLQVNAAPLVYSSDDDGKISKLMVAAEYEVVEPAEYAGSTVRDWYVVATNEAPNDVDPKAFGMRRLKSLFAAAGVGLDPDLMVCLDAVTGQNVEASIIQKPDDRGTTRNRITQFRPLGGGLAGSGNGELHETPAHPPTPPAAPAPRVPSSAAPAAPRVVTGPAPRTVSRPPVPTRIPPAPPRRS